MRQLFLSKPTAEVVRRFLAEQAELDFSYSAVGATSETPPAGYVIDRTKIELGSGESIFEAAKAALKRWQQFQLGWVDAWRPDTPLEAGQSVAVMGRAAGCWWLNACRVVYIVDEPGAHTKFGFAYGTLPGHVERGEQRFLIKWDQTTDQVSYDILALSRPNHVLTRLAYPMVRLSQKRFGRESAMAMFRAVSEESRAPDIYQSTG